MTQNHTLIRKSSVTEGDTDALDDYLVTDQWDPILWSNDSLNYTLDMVFVNLGSHSCDCGTTRVHEQSPLAELKVFPNPASGDVVWVNASSAIREVTLHNLAGQQVVHQAVNGLGVGEVRLDEVTAGLYLMEVILENGTRATRRVVRK